MHGNKSNKRREKIWIKITYSVLESLFAYDRGTIQRWINKGYLDPRNIHDIIDKYNNRWKLDRRKKAHATQLAIEQREVVDVETL